MNFIMEHLNAKHDPDKLPAPVDDSVMTRLCEIQEGIDVAIRLGGTNAGDTVIYLVQRALDALIKDVDPDRAPEPDEQPEPAAEVQP